MWKYFHSAVIAPICGDACGNSGRVTAAERVRRVVGGLLHVAAGINVFVAAGGRRGVMNQEETEVWNQC